MATYRMTPAERQALARMKIAERNQRVSYQKMRSEAKNAEAARKLEEQREREREAQRSSANVLERAGATVMDIGANIVSGAMKSVEGIADLGIGLVGAVGGLFDGDFQERVKDIVAFDATGKWIDKPMQEALGASYLKDDGIVENVASGIGGMLPAVAAALLTGGASAAASGASALSGSASAATQAASLATLGIGAAGNSTESAFNDGADYLAGIGFGVASGLVEVGTEKLFGGIGGAITGKGFFDNPLRSIASTGIARVAKGALEEGVEEVVAEGASPALKSIYKGIDAFKEYGDKEYWKGVGKAGLYGSAVALAYNGSVGYGLSKAGVGYVGKDTDIADSLEELQSIKEKTRRMTQEDLVDNEERIGFATRKNYENIEKTLKSVKENRRAEMIKNFSLEKAFDADGSLSQEMRTVLDGGTQSEAYNKKSYSFDLRGRENVIKSDLDDIKTDVVGKLTENNGYSAEDAAAVADRISVFDGELSDTAREGRNKFQRALNILDNLSGLRTSFVVTNENEAFHALITDGRMYIGADRFENGSWAGDLVHEYTHFAEGTEEYKRLADALQDEDLTVSVETENGTERKSLWSVAQDAVLRKGYGATEEGLKAIREKRENGTELSEEESIAWSTFQTELVAHETELLLGNEDFIDRIVSTDATLARRVIDKIKALSKALSQVGESGDAYIRVKKAEALYLAAAEKAGDAPLVRYIMAKAGEEEEDAQDVQMSMKEVTAEKIRALREIGRKSINQFTSEEIQKAEYWARKFWGEMKEKSPFFRAWFGDWRAYDVLPAFATKISSESKINSKNRSIHNNDTEWKIQITSDTIGDTLHYAKKEVPYLRRLLTNIDDVLERAILLDTSTSEKNTANKKGSTQFMHYLYSIVEYNEAPFLAKIVVEEYDTDGKHRAYNVSRIKMSELSRAQYSQMKSAYRGKYASNSDAISIADLHNLVKTYDKGFSPKPVNHLMLNEDGTPKVFYHGTNADFTVFDEKMIGSATDDGLYGKGFYFSSAKQQAEQYAGDKGGVKECYLKIKNPLVISKYTISELADILDMWEGNFTKDGSVPRPLVSRIEQFTSHVLDAGFDGVYVQREGAMDELVVFNRNNIKSATENIGTFDGENPDIRYNLTDIPYKLRKAISIEEYEGGIDDKFADAEKRGRDSKFKSENSEKTASDNVATEGKKRSPATWSSKENDILFETAGVKIYSKKEAKKALSGIIEKNLSFGDRKGILVGKARADAADLLWRGLNSAGAGERGGVALQMAEFIMKQAILENDEGEKRVSLYSVLSKEERTALKNGIVREVLLSFDGGKPSAMFQAVEKERKKAEDYKQKYIEKSREAEKQKKEAHNKDRMREAKDKRNEIDRIERDMYKEESINVRKYNETVNRVLDKLQKIKDIKMGTFLNQTQFKRDAFKGSIEKLAGIKVRGNLNKSGTRRILTGLREWYSKENPMLQGEGVFNEDIENKLKQLSEGDGTLDLYDLIALENVVDYFRHFIENYNKMWRRGKMVEAKPEAERYIQNIRSGKSVKEAGWVRKLFEKYLVTFADPITIARYMDRYENGFYSEMLEELKECAIAADVMEMDVRKPLEAFFAKNKKFFKEIENRKVKYLGEDMPVRKAMLLYMTLHREQAFMGLAKSGITFADGEKTKRIGGFDVNEMSAEVISKEAKTMAEVLEHQFTKTEMEYIKIAEKIFNEDCKEAKRKMDILRDGYSNALEGYYVPIRRANHATNVDASQMFTEMNRASNASFNKNTVEGAKNELEIGNLDEVLDKHIHDVAMYANLALAIDAYNILYNFDIGGNPNNVTSIETEEKNGWREGNAYFVKLIADMQGIPSVKGEGTALLSILRGGFAKYQLGGNPKVFVTQLSSLAAASSILDVGAIIRGIGINAADVDKYCRLAELRNNENTAALAQGVLETTGKIGDVLMKPIGMMDRLVVKSLFGACQVQIEKTEGLKLGTEENKQRAGELLQKVIIETQQNSLATERSAAMRSGNEFMKAITMFSADAMKVVGRVVDSFGEMAVLRARLKGNLSADVRADMEARLNAAEKKAVRSVGAIITTSIFMALIAQGFRWLYAKDKEDENALENMTVDAVGNLLGGLPLIRDVYARFTDGYELDNYAYSALNDLLNGAVGVYNSIGDIVSGEANSQTIAKTVRDMIYAAGQVLGIPVRNVYNIFSGLTKRLVPSAGYRLDDLFYSKSYKSDLKKAIENNDEGMIKTIASLMLDESFGGIEEKKSREELNRLISGGFDVLPRSVSKTVTYDGVEYTMTAKEKKRFEKVYAVANKALQSLVALPQYKGESDEVKVKAVKMIYKIYYDLAMQDFLGVDLETKSVLFAEAVDIEKLALIVSKAGTLVADVDKGGKPVGGSRKKKVQTYVESLKISAAEKYMIMGYLGYSNVHGKKQVESLIGGLNLTGKEKEKLLAYSGY